MLEYESKRKCKFTCENTIENRSIRMHKNTSENTEVILLVHVRTSQ